MAGLIRIGTAGWSIPASVRDRFPAFGSQLERYAARMNAAEINSSFYRPHQRKTYERWAEAVPRDFRFSVKLPRSITHEGRLRNFTVPLRKFLEEISGLQEKLGFVLVQLPPSLTFDKRVAAAFFSALSRRAPCTIACEPRHASWFLPEADGLLRRLGVARVAADPPRHPGDGMPGGTTDCAYWRWHGSPRMYWSAYSHDRLEALAACVRPAAKETWCIFDNTASGAALENALGLAAALPRAPGSMETGTKAGGALYLIAKQEESMARKYSKGASKKVERAMHEMHEGRLRSGGSGKKVTSRKQAVAIGLSEARAEGKKVPKKKTGARKTAKKKTATKKKTKR